MISMDSVDTEDSVAAVMGMAGFPVVCVPVLDQQGRVLGVVEVVGKQLATSAGPRLGKGAREGSSGDFQDSIGTSATGAGGMLELTPVARGRSAHDSTTPGSDQSAGASDSGAAGVAQIPFSSTERTRVNVGVGALPVRIQRADTSSTDPAAGLMLGAMTPIYRTDSTRSVLDSGADGSAQFASAHSVLVPGISHADADADADADACAGAGAGAGD